MPFKMKKTRFLIIFRDKLTWYIVLKHGNNYLPFAFNIFKSSYQVPTWFLGYVKLTNKGAVN